MYVQMKFYLDFLLRYMYNCIIFVNYLDKQLHRWKLIYVQAENNLI